ncbi:TIGR02186 family protein [Prosthecomicrobium sp. N25]|uniref:TIGR02186 family protein n=1 Tax=Prosthecomicrobium sp. N25 TaxID=3129254 RepID=UPI0030773959
MRLVLGLLAALALAVPSPARAETLVAVPSTSVVNISSNFAGTDITVFGSIERDRATVSRASEYHLAVMMFGPRETVVTRRKERTFGLWINRGARTYVDVPSFYAVLTNVPIAQVATPEVLKRYQVGIEHLLLPERLDGDAPAEPGDAGFRSAFLRLKLRTGLYHELPGAVSFLTGNLFRATIPIPANVPVGTYRIEVRLFQEGVPLAEQATSVVVSKTGFEQFTYDLAFTQPVVYGIITVLVALFTGWLAGVIFRRD